MVRCSLVSLTFDDAGGRAIILPLREDARADGTSRSFAAAKEVRSIRFDTKAAFRLSANSGRRTTAQNRTRRCHLFRRLKCAPVHLRLASELDPNLFLDTSGLGAKQPSHL